MAAPDRSASRKLSVLLIKPSKYDSEGYLVQFHKGVLPCNSLAAMHSLTREAFRAPEMSGLECEVRVFDESVKSGRIDARDLMLQHGGEGSRVVVGLVGVQTNMFPRARDLARQFKSLGATVVIGGFHVSGAITMMHDGKEDGIPCPGIMPPECRALIEEGIIIFHGEAEAIWPSVLRDIARGRTQPIYRGGQPSIASAPLPEYPTGHLDDFFGRFHTMDTGRGCPFKCSFCSIINVQGHDPRYRQVGDIVRRVREACRAPGSPFFFLTDDNFARNPYWKVILEELAQLQEEGLEFSFMVEADLAAYKLPRFIELLARAGATQVFMGVESVRQDTLDATRKPQNRVKNYEKMCDLYHQVGIMCHAGYIIGFPGDTPETVKEDVATLQSIGFDQVSFFILTPIPGSEDHIRNFVGGVPMDSDLNNYDSFQPVMDHPVMSRDEWQKTYDDAWRQYYSVEQMVASLKRATPGNYWGLLGNFVWYRWSAICEKTHPMMAGFYRYKRLADRRPEAAPLSPFRHAMRETWRHARYMGHLMREFFIFQDVYFQTQWLPQITSKLPHLGDFNERVTKRRLAIQSIGQEWSQRLQRSRWFGRTFGASAHRAWLNRFWQRYASFRWKLLLHPTKWGWHLRMLPHAVSEVVYTIRFGIAIFKSTANNNW